MSGQTQTSETLQIRFALPNDAEEIATVLHDSFAPFENLYTPGSFAYTILNVEKVKERFNEEGKIWVALKDEKIIGTVSAIPENDKCLYVRSMAVLPTAQGLGCGQKLLSEVERFAIENNFEKLTLCTTPFLSGAIRLYEKNGFERGEDVDGFFGTPLFAMEKKLNLSN